MPSSKSEYRPFPTRSRAERGAYLRSLGLPVGEFRFATAGNVAEIRQFVDELLPAYGGTVHFRPDRPETSYLPWVQGYTHGESFDRTREQLTHWPKDTTLIVQAFPKHTSDQQLVSGRVALNSRTKQVMLEVARGTTREVSAGKKTPESFILDSKFNVVGHPTGEPVKPSAQFVRLLAALKPYARKLWQAEHPPLKEYWRSASIEETPEPKNDDERFAPKIPLPLQPAHTFDFTLFPGRKPPHKRLFFLDLAD